MPMPDSEVVASILSGDPDGLAEAYDRYAAPLFTYCCTLLREPADAADVVQDTFVIASARLASLRDPDRLRPWLFAVARNGCMRRLRDRSSTAAFDDAADITDETADVGGDAERAELRALLRAALRGLNDGDRDLIVMQLSQGLDVAEIAASLGVTRNAAHSLLSRARAQLQAAVGVILVGRMGRSQCPALDEMLAGWDGQLTVLLRKRVNRHIEHCPVCTARRQHELRPAMLLSLAGGPALLGAAAAVHHAQTAGQVTAALRDQALATATSQGPTAVARQAAILEKAGAFGSGGFPRPLNAPRAWLPRTRHAQVAAAAGTAAAVTTGAVLLTVLSGGPRHAHLAAGGPAGPGGASASGPASPGSPSPGSPSPGSPSPGSSSPGSPTGPPSPSPGSSAGGSPGRGGTGTGGTGPGTVVSFPSGPAPSTVGGQPPSTPGQPPAASPTSTAPPTVPPTTTASPPPPAAGTINVSPSTVLLTPLLGSSFTITASGGPVSWSISEPSSLLGKVTLSQSSGTLTAGQSVTVSISTSLASLDSRITVSPGGEQVAVIVGLL
jgi:RNA polymerase sigma factor (sigma-70 family)